MSKTKKEVIEKIFYVSKELEELKTILCADGGKKYSELNYIIARISDIIDFTNSKKREIFNEKEEEVITTDNEFISYEECIGPQPQSPSPIFTYTYNRAVSNFTDESFWATPF